MIEIRVNNITAPISLADQATVMFSPFTSEVDHGSYRTFVEVLNGEKIEDSDLVVEDYKFGTNQILSQYHYCMLGYIYTQSLYEKQKYQRRLQRNKNHPPIQISKKTNLLVQCTKTILSEIVYVLQTRTIFFGDIQYLALVIQTSLPCPKRRSLHH